MNSNRRDYIFQWNEKFPTNNKKVVAFCLRITRVSFFALKTPCGLK